ncbi:hypothetical protein GIV19_01635 [Pseudomonas syringae]|uniref:hypothetical protein n=1 Tax=Pseudomonas syringae group TaxID=136849 RepID=UPI000EFAE61C|nr:MULTISPECIES: hypothetical protein [Pseudomonas syringae group]MCF5705986.1 hypothetical protein [Pseudomonas syringae]
MKRNYIALSFLALTTLGATVTAQAGPAVTITFKNLGTEHAEYKPVTRNEKSTQLNARSQISLIVQPGASDSYNVQSTISPDTNYASVRYVMGSKACTFSTTFIKAQGAGGAKVPKWNRTASPEGGAVCTATSRVTNFSTHAWAAEFTMK